MAAEAAGWSGSAPGARLCRRTGRGRRTPISRVAGEPAALRWFLLVSFLLNFGQGVYPPLLPEVVTALGLSLAAAGFLGTAFSLPRLLLTLPAGMLVERIGAAPMMHAGMALILAGTLAAATASSLTTMALARAIVGLGYGATALVGIVYLMQTGLPNQRTRRGNMYEGALISANAVSGYLAGAITVSAGWRWGFGAAAVAVASGWLAAAWRVLPAIRIAFRDRPAAPGAPTAAGPVSMPRSSPVSLFAIYLVAFGLAFGWAGAIVTLAPLYGGQALGLSAVAIGRALAIGYVVEAALLIPVGWGADTFGRLRVLLPGMALLVAGVVLLPLTGGLPGYTLSCTLVIVGMTVWMIPPSLLAEHLHGHFGTRTVGIYRFITDVGMVVAPATIGWLTGWGGFGVGATAVALVLVGCGGVVGVVLGPGRLRSGGGRR
jgi:DHA1 family multidrug resistance protein-like MFS transporter